MDTTPVPGPVPRTGPEQKKGFGEVLGSALGGFARGAGGALSVLAPVGQPVGGIVSGVASAVSALTLGGAPRPIQSDADLLALALAARAS